MTRRGKETDNPVFLLKRKRGGGSALFRSPLSSWLCCFSCCITEHLLLRSLMRHQGLRIITVYYKRLVEFCHLVYTDKKIVHDLHTANLPANASTQLCVVAQRASDMKAVDPPTRILASTMHSDVSPQLVTGSVRKYWHKDTTWCVCAPLCAIGLPLQHVLELQFPQWWRGVEGVNSLTLFLWECDVNSNMGTQWAIKRSCRFVVTEWVFLFYFIISICFFTLYIVL